MPIDSDAIKDAYDKFEAEDFYGAKEILRAQIKNAKNEYIADKTGIEGYAAQDAYQASMSSDDDFSNM